MLEETADAQTVSHRTVVAGGGGVTTAAPHRLEGGREATGGYQGHNSSFALTHMWP